MSKRVIADNYYELFSALVFNTIEDLGLSVDQVLEKMKAFYQARYTDSPLLAEFRYINARERFLSGKPELADVNAILSSIGVSLLYETKQHDYNSQEASPKEEPTNKAQQGYPSIWNEPIESLNLTQRLINVLKMHEPTIEYIGQLIAYKANALLTGPHIGRTSLSKIVAALTEKGLHLETDTGMWIAPAPKPKAPVYPEIWSESIDDLDLPVRITNCLKAYDYRDHPEGIRYIGQLLGLHRNEVMKIVGIGHSSFNVIEVTLTEKGLAFGTDLQGWVPPVTH